jgi:acetyltransferase-like isoleucine patch superfamily enzyme
MNLSKILERILHSLASKVRPGAIAISPKWSAGDLASQGLSRLVAGIRGRLMLVGARGGTACLVERGVSISGRRHLSVGRGTLLERGVTIRAFGVGGLTIGNGVTIGRYSVVEVSSGLQRPEGAIVLGDGVGISDHCYLGGAGGLTIGEDTIVGQSVSFHAENHTATTGSDIKSQEVTREGIRVGRGCWIGAGARILDGVAIGDYTTIGAGSVVTRSIPPNSVAYGVPARVHPQT